jgi:hypothetical protein
VQERPIKDAGVLSETWLVDRVELISEEERIQVADKGAGERREEVLGSIHSH